MRARQGPAALARVEREAERPHRLHVRRALHVAELAPVQEAVLLDALGPPEVDVAGGLHHPLAVDDARPGLVPALRQMVLQYGLRGLLDLQEERVLLVAALQQHDERPRADAADADDLARHVDHLEPLEQVTAV